MYLLFSEIVYLAHRTQWDKKRSLSSLQICKSFDTSWNGVSFTFLVGFGALTLGTLIDASVKIMMFGSTIGNLAYLSISALGLGLCLLGTAYVIYRSDLRTGLIKRRVKAFEVGWSQELRE